MGGSLLNSQVFKRFKKRKSSLIGGIIILIFVLTALIGPRLCKYDPNAIDLPNKYQNPSLEHWLGTDNLGRDTLTRLVYGARVSLMMSVVSVCIGSFIGVILGVVAGYYGGWIDAVISRFVDLILAFPGLLLAIAVVAVLGPGIPNTMAAIAFYSIPYVARLVRGLVISLKNTEFIQASKVIGSSDLRIIVFHIIPNTMGQIIINVTLSLGTAILTASSLSFLGLGVQPPNPEWGAMLSQAREVIRNTPIAALAPGIAITLVVLSFSLVGDGLRDALDPKLKNS
ncbi:MAG: ABC transporter permease [Clostridiales bacterium]|nr:ABC transporter permease [Clostridiales bacterium]